MRVFVLRLYTKFEVRRPFRSEDMMHFRSQHCRPSDLDLRFWPWNWCALLPMGWTTFLPILVFLGRFVLDLSANTCHASHDLATLTFDLGGHGVCWWCGSSSSVCVPSLKFVGLPVLKILGIYCVSINLFSDLCPWDWCALFHVGWTTILSIFVFLAHFVHDLSVNTCQMHHVTLRPWSLTLNDGIL